MKFNLNKISLKLLVVCLSFTLPIAVMLSLMTKAKQKDINFALWEMKGNAYQRPLESLLENVSMHRWLEVRRNLGETTLAAELVPIEGAIDVAFTKLQAVDAEVGTDLQFTEEGLGKRQRQEFTVKSLGAKIEHLKESSGKTNIDDSEKLHKDLIAHIKTMITHAGDTSNLILDPDLDSYYLMDVTLLALPQTQDRMQEIASFVERIIKQGTISQAERVKASVLASFLREADLDRMNASSQTSLNEDTNFYGLSETLQTNLKSAMTSNTPAVEVVIAKLNDLALISNVASFDLPDFRIKLAAAIKSLYSFHAISFDELDALLKKRVSVFKNDVNEAIQWTALSLAFSAILALLITVSIIRRIGRLNVATKVIAAGDLNSRVNMKSSDELGELARSFDSMTDRIGSLNGEIAAKNDELKGINANLENMVAERTATIKTILDNVKFGFLLIDHKLNIQEGFSRVCLDLLGNKLKVGTSFLKAIGVADTRNGPMFEEFLKQTFEDELPVEMTLQQLPARVQIGEKILSLIAGCVRDADNTVQAILFTIIDATNLEKMEKENHRHKVLVRLLKEIDSFKDFLEESRTRIGLCRNFMTRNEQGKVRAELHTMKGNTAAYDMIDIAKLIHTIEDNSKIDISDIDRIESAYIGFLESNFDVLQLPWSGESVENFAVSRRDIEDIINRVRVSAGTDHAAINDLTEWANSIQYKSARSLIGALPDYGERLSSRLGKPCNIRVEGGDVKMNPEIVRPIMQSLVHLVRNSIDHGIELPFERGTKPESGSIQIVCSESTNEWNIRVSDDGRGIDADRLVEKAIKNGHITPDKSKKMSTQEKLRLVFLNGVSTSEEVSDISGRGVGMSAVEASVLEAGGRLEIETKPASGTSVSIWVPKVSATQKMEFKKAS